MTAKEATEGRTYECPSCQKRATVYPRQLGDPGVVALDEPFCLDHEVPLAMRRVHA